MNIESNENIELEYAVVEFPDEDFNDIEYRDNSSYDGESAELDRVVMPEDLAPVGDDNENQFNPDDPETYSVIKENPTSYFKDWNKCLDDDNKSFAENALTTNTQSSTSSNSIQIGSVKADPVPELDNCISKVQGNNSGLGTAALLGAAAVMSAAKVIDTAKAVVTNSNSNSETIQAPKTIDEEFSKPQESRGAAEKNAQRTNEVMNMPNKPASKYSTANEEHDSLINKYFQFGGTCNLCNGTIKPKTNRCSGCGNEVNLQGKTIKRMSVGTQLAPWVAEPIGTAKFRSIMLLFLLIGAIAYYVHSANLGLETGVAAITILIVGYSILSGMYMGIKKMLIIKRHRDEYIKLNPGLSDDIRRNLAKGWFHPEMSIYEMELCGGYRTRPRVKEDAICVEVGKPGSDS